MTLKELKQTPKEQIEKLAASSTSYSELFRSLNVVDNGKTRKFFKDKFGLLSFKTKELKYKRTSKTCPVCGKTFIALSGSPREKTVCSYACSNTLYRSGANNGSHTKAVESGSVKNYRARCFAFHPKRCCVCGEDRIVEVHHYDGNHKNVDPMNLIPLCPIDHQLYHTDEHHKNIKEHIDEYLNSLV